MPVYTSYILAEIKLYYSDLHVQCNKFVFKKEKPPPPKKKKKGKKEMPVRRKFK